MGGSQKNSANLKLDPAIVGHVIYTADASGLVQAIDRSERLICYRINN